MYRSDFVHFTLSKRSLFMKFSIFFQKSKFCYLLIFILYLNLSITIFGNLKIIFMYMFLNKLGYCVNLSDELSHSLDWAEVPLSQKHSFFSHKYNETFG